MSKDQGSNDEAIILEDKKRKLNEHVHELDVETEEGHDGLMVVDGQLESVTHVPTQGWTQISSRRDNQLTAIS